MTDARFPERWLNNAQLQSVSASAYRLYGNALMWAVANRTDGHLPSTALAMIPHATKEDAGELETVSLWLDDGAGGWLIVGYEHTQTTRAQLEAAEQARAHERDKKARQRKHKAGDHSLCGDDCLVSPGTDPGTSPGKTQDRPGQARTTRTGSTTSSSVTNPSTNDETVYCADCKVVPVGVMGQAVTRKAFGRVLCSACSREPSI